jgi:hypothetical protein
MSSSSSAARPLVIVPVRPPAAHLAEAPSSSRPAGLLRRAFGRNLPSRRTLGRGNPSRRTFGRNEPSRRTFGLSHPSRRTFGLGHP